MTSVESVTMSFICHSKYLISCLCSKLVVRLYRCNHTGKLTQTHGPKFQRGDSHPWGMTKMDSSVIIPGEYLNSQIGPSKRL